MKYKYIYIYIIINEFIRRYLVNEFNRRYFVNEYGISVKLTNILEQILYKSSR